jgi:hypothetical protein
MAADMKWLLHPATVTAAGVLAVLAATGITLHFNADASGGSGKTTAAVCERLAVPAYFSPPYWETAIHSKYPPADMILDVNGVGAGTAPDTELQGLVRQAMAAGITVLGYSSTVDGQRPVAQVEADVRDYAAWYGVTSIFLDRVSGKPQQLAYYKRLADYIHQAHRGAQVWLNPGDYPDQSYMSVGDVVMVFEGSYAQYLTDSAPSWASRYPATRFAQTIYATPQAVLDATLRMAQRRAAGHVFVTDLVEPDPYQGLPSYWQAEDADVAAGCVAGARQTAAPRASTDSSACAARTLGQSRAYQSCAYDLQVLLNDLRNEGVPGPSQQLATDGYYGALTASDVASYNAVNVHPSPGGVATPATWRSLCLQDHDRGLGGSAWTAAGCAAVVNPNG